MARISGFLKRLFHRSPEVTDATVEAPGNDAQPRKEERMSAPRPTQRQTDIPLDVITQAYTPPATSSKASFRSDGSDHQSDQEIFALTEGRWNDEDRFTNKSGDPRIGTHRRNSEPDESRGETRQ